MSKPVRVNERIRIREVRLIDEAGRQLGLVPTAQALAVARERGLDLVEVAPNAIPLLMVRSFAASQTANNTKNAIAVSVLPWYAEIKMAAGLSAISKAGTNS